MTPSPRNTRGGIEAHDAFAQEHQGPDIGLPLLVGPQDLQAGVFGLGHGKGNLELHDPGGIIQAPDMLRQAEDGGAAVMALVGPDALEDPQAVVQGVR